MLLSINKKIFNLGKSYVISLPKIWLDSNKIRAGQEVLIEITEIGLIIKVP